MISAENSGFVKQAKLQMSGCNLWRGAEIVSREGVIQKIESIGNLCVTRAKNYSYLAAEKWHISMDHEVKFLEKYIKVQYVMQYSIFWH